MKTNFNIRKRNIKRLRPRPEDIELNKCTHYLGEDGRCSICGIELETEIVLEDLYTSSETIIDYLETLKMLSEYVLTKKERKAAQRYFNMIPLLKNIIGLYDVCNDANWEYLNNINKIIESEVTDPLNKKPDEDVSDDNTLKEGNSNE